MKSSKETPPLKFETVMENLQTIVQEMESGDLPLDDLIGRYEEGMRLVKISRDKLAQAEQKIEVLTKNQEKNSASEPTPSAEPPARAKSGEDIGLF